MIQTSNDSSDQKNGGGFILYFIIGLLSIAIVILVLLHLSDDSGRESVMIESFQPTGETPQTTNITVVFDRDIVPDSLIDVGLTARHVRFEPDIQGEYRWVARNKLRFYPDYPLAPSTEYTATIDEAVAPAMMGLKGEKIFKFKTARLRVNSASLVFEYNPDDGGTARLLATIEFNHPVDPIDASEKIKIRFDDGGAIPFRVTTQTASDVIALETEYMVRLDEDRKIKLVIDESLTCVGGKLGLPDRYEKPAILRQIGNLKVYGVSAVQDGPKRRKIRIEFNLPINRESAAIHVEPQIEFSMRSTHHYLELRGEFELDKKYSVTVGKDIRGIDGSTLERAFTGSVIFRKEPIRPQLQFVGDGYYLTRGGRLNTGLSTINVDSVTIEIDKVFVNNIVHLLHTTNLSPSSSRYYYSRVKLRQFGKRIESFDIAIPGEQDKEVVAPINIEKYLDTDRKGIYRITARNRNNRWLNASRWVLATDIGIIAKRAGDDLWVWVNSLSSLDPINGAVLTLISENNQKLLTATTDRDGIAIFKSLSQIEEQFTPFVIAAEHNDDITFMKLPGNKRSVSDFDVGGRPNLESGYEAFIYGERNIYRPGETAHLAAIVRGRQAASPEPFPVILSVTGPDGRILSEQRSTLDNQGGVQFDIPVPAYAKTGRYSARLLLSSENEIGSTRFYVEEFIPDRMKVRIETGRKSYIAGDSAAITVEAVTLFGPPASGRQVKSDLEIEAIRFTSDNWKDFAFHDARKSFSEQKIKLNDATLDDDGRHTYTVAIPANLDPQSSLRGVMSSTVLEPGGRGVTAYKGFVIHPRATYVGLRRTEEGYARPDQETGFQLVVTDTDGDLIGDRDVEVLFYRVYWHSVLKRSGSRGYYRYVSEKVEELDEQFTVKSADDPVAFSVTPTEYGRYLVVVRDMETGASASMSFYSSGWGYSPWAMENPDRVEIDPDKAVYNSGQTAQLQIRSPFPGKLILTVERDRILYHNIVTLDSNTAVVSIPIADDFAPNAYVSVHLIRSTIALDRDMPAAAFGVVPLMINNEANKLSIDFDVPSEIRPKTTLPIEFHVSGFKGKSPHVTIAAVDEGILQLTDFQTPDPFTFFFGKRRLSVSTHDMYKLILPEIEPTPESAPGDIEASRKRHLTPTAIRRVKPVAFWSGILETDRDGFGKISFDIPQFNGTLRLMAVAYADDMFGNAQRDLLVREPIVITPTFPRFIGSGDSLVIPVGIFNGTGSDGTFSVDVSINGDLAIAGEDRLTASVPDQKEKYVFFHAIADKTLGKVHISVTASGNGESSEVSADIPVRPPVPFTTLSGAGSIDAGDTLSFDFPGDWIPGTAEFSLQISSMPTVKFARSLQYLLRYPHGCVEQTTSRLFPLLYFDQLAQNVEPELFEKNGAEYFIEEGITKIENLQLSSGAFSYWPRGDYIHNWSSVYTSHFLVEARRAGYDVSTRVYDRMMNALKRAAARRDDRHSYQTSAYACYVLALAGNPDRSTMHFIKDSRLDKLSEYSQYQLAGAFALSGDMNNARALLPKTAALRDEDGERESGGNFNSPVRAKAIILDVLTEIDLRSPLIPRLVEDLSDAASKDGRWRTTQENAFAFLALGKLLSKHGEIDYTGSIAIDGEHIADFDTGNHRFKSKDWSGMKATISVEGSGTCYFYWRADGLPSGLHVDEFDNDLIVRRRYLSESGEEVHYADFKQGDLIVAEITVMAPNDGIDNVAIVDMLPAGFEIENPRLQSRKGITWIGDKALKPGYMDIRDDRLIIYGDFSHGRTESFYYSLRAVTRGKFTVPSIRAEAMYAPMKASVASSGEIIVSTK